MPLVHHADLQKFIHDLFFRLGVNSHDAALAASSLVAANLYGVDSHGVQLVPPYTEQLVTRNIDHRTSGRISKKSDSCVLYDGENALGQAVAVRCCDEAVRLARTFGTGLVVARNSNHFGRAAFWGSRIAESGCVGLVFSNASPLVAPWQGREPRLGTNPVCIAVPGGWILDMATTTVAAGRIIDTVLSGKSTIPEGWALDSKGVPTTTASAAMKGTLLPLGGREAGFKGTGLAVAIEILCGVLSGGAITNEVGSLRSRNHPAGVSHSFLAIDVQRFLSVHDFTSKVAQLMGILKATPVAPGFEEILMAGEREKIVEKQRLRDGIPVPPHLWVSLSRLADTHKLDPPKTL
jgi:LDH2 family malate/lactate/ureidoglycolate dehydrogenase